MAREKSERAGAIPTGTRIKRREIELNPCFPTILKSLVLVLWVFITIDREKIRIIK